MVIKIKTIGIIIRDFNENNKTFIGTRYGLFKALEPFPVSLIGIPITSDFAKIKETVNLCNGIILSGGEKLLDNDFKLVSYLYDQDIPTLGICLGMQSMAEAYNNQKEEYLENHYSSNKYVHEVILNTNSLLFKIIGKKRIMVNSIHHYVITDTNFLINALSNDPKIEGIEACNKKFFLGIEWHPESLQDENSNKLFKYFIDII